jgi:hypothetical protein
MRILAYILIVFWAIGIFRAGVLLFFIGTNSTDGEFDLLVTGNINREAYDEVVGQLADYLILIVVSIVILWMYH